MTHKKIRSFKDHGFWQDGESPPHVACLTTMARDQLLGRTHPESEFGGAQCFLARSWHHLAPLERPTTMNL